MSLDGLITPAVPSDTRDATPLRGQAVAAPAGGRVRVVVRSLSPTREIKPARYVAPAGTPAPGEECLVLIDERGESWALFSGAGP